MFIKGKFKDGSSVADVKRALAPSDLSKFSERSLHDFKYKLTASKRHHPSDMEACKRLAER